MMSISPSQCHIDSSDDKTVNNLAVFVCILDGIVLEQMVLRKSLLQLLLKFLLFSANKIIYLPGKSLTSSPISLYKV